MLDYINREVINRKEITRDEAAAALIPRYGYEHVPNNVFTLEPDTERVEKVLSFHASDHGVATISFRGEHHKVSAASAVLGADTISINCMTPFGIKWHETDQNVSIRVARGSFPSKVDIYIISVNFNIIRFDVDWLVHNEESAPTTHIVGRIISERFEHGDLDTAAMLKRTMARA